MHCCLSDWRTTSVCFAQVWNLACFLQGTCTESIVFSCCMINISFGMGSVSNAAISATQLSTLSCFIRDAIDTHRDSPTFAISSSSRSATVLTFLDATERYRITGHGPIHHEGNTLFFEHLKRTVVAHLSPKPLPMTSTRRLLPCTHAHPRSPCWPALPASSTCRYPMWWQKAKSLFRIWYGIFFFAKEWIYKMQFECVLCQQRKNYVGRKFTVVMADGKITFQYIFCRT